MQHSERIERSRRVFQSDSEAEDHDDHDVEEHHHVEVEEDDEAVHRGRSRSRSRGHYSEDVDSEESDLMQRGLVLHLGRAQTGASYGMCRSEPHVTDLWCVSFDTAVGQCEFESEDGHTGNGYMGCNFSSWWWGVLCSEWAIVFYVAIACILRMIQVDVCKCRCKRLCKVRNVRHQVRRKRPISVSFVVIFMICIVLMQHAIGGVQGVQLRARHLDRDDGSGFQYSTFKDLPPPGNGSPRFLQLAEMLPVGGAEAGTGNAGCGAGD